jgi:spore germination protein KB
MRVQISNGMFMALIINMVYAKAIGVTQGTMAREVGSDMWISSLFATLFGVLFMYLMVYIIKRIPQKDLIEHTRLVYGKWVSKLAALIVLLFFLFAVGPIMATFVYHLKDYFLPDTPVYYFIIAAILIGTYAIFFGVEVISRMALLGVFSVVSLNILLLLGSLSEFDIRELLPTFQSGFFPSLWASRHQFTDWSLPIMMAAIILPLVKDPETWGKSGFSGVFFGGMFVVMWPILEAGVLSPEVTGAYLISCMQMARSAQIGQFIHRYEMIMIAFFSLSILTQIMMTFLCASVAVQKMFGLKDYRPVIIPVTLLLGGYGYWVVVDHHRAMEMIENYWVLVSIGITVTLTIILSVIGIFLKKKYKRINRELKESE